VRRTTVESSLILIDVFPLRPGGNTVWVTMHPAERLYYNLRHLHSSDSSIYDPTLVGDQQLVLSSSAAVWQTRYGPSYFDSLNLLPNSTKITMDINLRNASYELSKAQVAAAQKFLGRKLDAVESMLFSTSFKQILMILFHSWKRTRLLRWLGLQECIYMEP